MKYPWCTILLLLVIAGGLVGCSGPKETAPVDDDPSDVVNNEPIRMADYEDFDASGYIDTPPPEDPISHDVPAALITGQTGQGTTERVQGYRIQIFSSKDKADADRELDGAVSWWHNQKVEGYLDDLYEGREASPPVYMIFRQPYYRVRLGNFATRDEALRLLPTVQRRFPSAFIAFDTVTLSR